MKPLRSTASPSRTTPRAKPLLAEVAPAVPLTGARTTYTYRLPKNLKIEPLSAVTIPFGPRQVKGIVLEVHQRLPRHPLKSITAAIPAHLTHKQLQFAQWIVRTMHGSLGFTLRLFLPAPHSSAKTQSEVGSSSLPKNHIPEVKQYLQTLKKTDAALVEADTDKRSALLKSLASAFARQTKKTVVILVPEKVLLRNYAGLPAVTADLKSTGAAPVLVGTQKALFLPYANVGLIIVEEEAWPTHKLWDQYPRLSNLDGAKALATIHAARILWSGSFPSVRLYTAWKDKALPAPAWNPLAAKSDVHLFSNVDRAKKSLLPLSLIDTLRRGLAQKLPTLVLYNRQDGRVKQLRHLFHRAFGKNFSHLTLATSAIFADAQPSHFKQAAWLFPESTFTYPDFRSEEHGLIMLARLQSLLPPTEKVHIATRSLTLAQRLLQWKPLDWYDAILRERRALTYPPLTDMLKLTITEKTAARALRRAAKLRETLAARMQAGKLSARIQGPFASLGTDLKKVTAQQHLLLLGDAATLPDLYQDLKIDAVDVSPQRVL